MSSSRSRWFLTAVVSASGRARAGRRGVRRGLPVALAAALLVPAVGIGVIAPSPAAAATCDLDGEGTSGSPFQVGSADDLAKVGVGACGLTAHYLQIANITLTAPDGAGSNHVPIGAVSPFFTGTYDGGKHRITGLVINSKGSNVGMFGVTGGGSVLKNIRMHDVTVTTNSFHVGSLVGQHAGRIENVSVNGATVRSSSGEDGLVGGLVGYSARGHVHNVSVMDATISAAGYGVGGVVGFNDGGEIHNVSVLSSSVSSSGLTAVSVVFSETVRVQPVSRTPIRPRASARTAVSAVWSASPPRASWLRSGTLKPAVSGWKVLTTSVRPARRPHR
jgi:hypothetical protein